MPYGIQQPAISGQLSQLEKALGVRLFERRPFGLNPAGAKLFKEIEPFFAGLRDLPAHVRGFAQQHLRLAAPGRILRDYLPDVIVRYKRYHPNLELTLYDANQARAEELLRRREVDIAITEIEGPMPGSFVTCELVQLPLILVVPRRSKLRAVTDLFSDSRPIEKLISLRPSEVLSKNFRTGLSSLGLHWSIAIEVISLELIDIYTSLGFGVGSSVFIPGRKIPRDLRLIPLPKFPRLTIGAFWLGELSPIANSVLIDLKKIAEKLEGQLRSKS